jgi:hypothetical protein
MAQDIKINADVLPSKPALTRCIAPGTANRAFCAKMRSVGVNLAEHIWCVLTC